jgi:ribosomal protein RSM22 (predicted rRNA methylase)
MIEDLQQAIDSLIQAAAPSSLKKASVALSQAYRHGQGSRSIFENEPARLAYLAARMPATFGAIRAVLAHLPVSPAAWLDLGAGPGTASWAAASLFPQSKTYTLIEKNSHAIAIGKRLAIGHQLLETATWIPASLPTELPAADAAILSYSLGELERPSQLIDCWWKAEIPLIVIVEPGTPRGFSTIKKARDQILSLGGCLIAPCPHALRCPLKENDWCHFSVRIARSRLHRYLKAGALGHEDEKYSYLIGSKPDANILGNQVSRILRQPQKNSGHVRLSLCTALGSVADITIGRSNQKFYRKARDASWGDAWESPQNFDD